MTDRKNLSYYVPEGANDHNHNTVEQIDLNQGSLTLFYRMPSGILEAVRHSYTDAPSFYDINHFPALKAIHLSYLFAKHRLYTHKWSRQLESVMIDGHDSDQFVAQIDRFDRLRRLSLPRNRIASPLPDGMAARLEYLEVSAVKDIGLLQECGQLRTLRAGRIETGGNPVTLPSVRRLRLDSGLSALGAFPEAREVVYQGHLASLAPFAVLEALERLELAGGYVHDLAPLGGAVRWLHIRDNMIEDIGPLAGRALEHLNISSNPVADLSPLEGMDTLQTLDITDTWVTDIAPLRGCTGLRSIRIDLDKIIQREQIKALSHVEQINGKPFAEVADHYGLYV